MSERWLTQSENLLKSLRELKAKKGEDRLEIIKSMFFILYTLDRSMQGWRSWIRNLDFMSRFSEKELRELEEGLIGRVQAFIEYDIDVTKKYMDKIPTAKFKVRRRKQEVDTGRMFA